MTYTFGNNNNNNNEQKPIKNGLTFCDLLTIVFVVLKLCGVIDWSWWWILSPILIPWGLIIILLLILGICEYISNK